MLFEMYTTPYEKIAPTTYEGAPIFDERDLYNLIEEKAGHELMLIVEKYINSIQKQANKAIQNIEESSEQDYYEAALEERVLQLQDVEDEINSIEDSLNAQLFERKRIDKKELIQASNRLGDLWKSIHSSL